MRRATASEEGLIRETRGPQETTILVLQTITLNVADGMRGVAGTGTITGTLSMGTDTTHPEMKGIAGPSMHTLRPWTVTPVATGTGNASETETVIPAAPQLALPRVQLRGGHHPLRPRVRKSIVYRHHDRPPWSSLPFRTPATGRRSGTMAETGTGTATGVILVAQTAIAPETTSIVTVGWIPIQGGITVASR